MSFDYSSQQSSERGSFSPTSRYPKFGYNVYDIESFDSRLKCLFCKLLINEAIQFTECGHRVCQGCFEVRANAAADGMVDCPDEECPETANKDQTMPDKAFRREVNVLSVSCRFRSSHNCTWTGLLKDYQAHLDANHVHYVCPQCQERFSSELQLTDHLTKCPVLYQQCPLAPLCTDEMILKTTLAQHFCTEKHQETVAKMLTGEYQMPENMNTEEEAEREALNKELEEKTLEKCTTLTNDMQQLHDTSAKLDGDFLKLQEQVKQANQELNNCYQLTNERMSVRHSLQPSQEKLQKDLEQAQQMFESSQHVFTDGTLTWRIEHVAEKMADAQSERQTSIYSPVFYSSSTGYKMRVRLFLFGDGNARRSHISLFFQLMKGDYDAILKWPFHYKVTFSLLDQTGNNRHIIDSFYPDVKSSSFQRPKEATNSASGIPKFFPLPMLQQDDNAYVREDTMYIKIIIGLNETPKVLLPFILTLNPALPTYVQENLIQKEAVKQQQQQAATVNNPQSTPMVTGK